VIENQVVIPVAYRPRIAAIKRGLHVFLSGWDLDFGNLNDWYREA
jgi:peptide/nickel transport system substrate-binding protein